MKIGESTCAKPTYVNAYLDGTATGIEARVLDGVDQFERAVDSSSQLTVVVDGQRNRVGWRSGLAGLALGAAVVAGATALCTGAITLGFGAAALGVLVGLPSLSSARQDFEAENWGQNERYTVGGASVDSSHKSALQRLDSLLEENPTKDGRRLAYFSGHGTQDTIAGLKTVELAQALEGEQYDLTIFDVCLASQLEVLSRLAPWAGIAIASPQPIPAKGFPIEKLLSKDNLCRPEPREFATELAKTAAPAAKSLVAIDTRKLAGSGLQNLDKLGQLLTRELQNGKRGEIKRALRHSVSPKLLSSKVDLKSFLGQLGESELSPTTLLQAEQTLTVLEQAVLFQKSKLGLSFDLLARDLPPSLKNWEDFVSRLDLRRKPIGGILSWPKLF